MYKMMHNNDVNYLRCRDNIYYFVRRIPVDIDKFYSSNRISLSLKTKSIKVALHKCKSISQRLDDYWLGLRLQNLDIPALHLVKSDGDDNSPTLTDALDLYLRLKGSGKDRVFIRTAKRNAHYVIKVLGNRPISSYLSSDAGKFRDWLLDKGMTIRTVKRVFSSVRAIINLTITEQGINCNNAFSRTYMPDDNTVQSRKPIPIDDIKIIQSKCKEYDDEIRWLISLLSDTGMRLSEGAGLLKSDMNLNNDIPYINITPHPWRRLKTKGSERTVPLVGSSLWACERILANANDSIYAFPRYTDHNKCNSNSASAALNKWLKEQLLNPYQVHGFRHSMRDRLRAVECPSELIDQICGWSNKSVGEGYGKGYSLQLMHRWIDKTQR